MTDSFNRKPKTTRPKWQWITAWTLQIVAAIVFFMSGGAKLIGVERMVTLFSDIGWGQWFRYLTGLLEWVGVALLMLPRTAFWGGLLMAVIMVGGILTHLVLVGGSPAPPFVFLCITVAIAWLRRP